MLLIVSPLSYHRNRLTGLCLEVELGESLTLTLALRIFRILFCMGFKAFTIIHLLLGIRDSDN